MAFQDLTYERLSRTALVTLDRPDARNAYSEAMVASLLAALDLAEADDAVRCLVLTGAGGAFSAGGDLKRMRNKEGMFEGAPIGLKRNYEAHIQRIPRRFARFGKPVLAAVNGPAIGAGLDLACMTDIRWASPSARFGSTFVKVGLVPGDGGAYFLTRAIGFPRAIELLLSGRVIEVDEAERIGLVHRVVEAEALVEQTLAHAESIADNAPLAVQLTKRAAYRSWASDLETALELAASYQGMTQNTEDHLEAVDALLEKRAPSFRGR